MLKKVDSILQQQSKISENTRKQLESHLGEFSKMKEIFELTFDRLKDFNLLMHEQFMKEMDFSYKKIVSAVRKMSKDGGVRDTKQQILSLKLPCKWGVISKNGEPLPELLSRILDKV